MRYVDGTIVNQRKLLKSNRGSTVPMVLFFLMAGMTMMTSMNQPTNTNRESLNARYLGVRDSLASQLRSYSAMPATFRTSVDQSLPSTENEALKVCIFGDSSATPVLCEGGGVEQAVTLYYPIPPSSGGVKNFQLLAGPGPFGATDASPAKYNIKGEACDANRDLVCPFEAYATFRANCAGGAVTCPVAESIAIHYYLRNVKTSSTVSLYEDNMKNVVNMAPVEGDGKWVDLVDILPPLYGAASQNVVVTTIVDPTATTTVSITPPVVTPIDKAIAKAGITDTTTIALIKAAVAPIKSTKVAAAIAGAGITDPAIALAIQDVIKAAGITETKTMNIIAQLGITNLSTAIMLSNTGIESASFAKIVIDSGITNSNVANAVYDIGIHDPVQLAAINTAVANVTNPKVQFALAKNAVTSATTATAIANAVQAAGVTNSIGINAIVKAGVTDPAQALIIAQAAIDAAAVKAAAQAAAKAATAATSTASNGGSNGGSSSNTSGSSTNSSTSGSSGSSGSSSTSTSTASSSSTSGSTSSSTSTSSAGGSTTTTTTGTSGGSSSSTVAGGVPPDVPIALTPISTCSGTTCGTVVY